MIFLIVPYNTPRMCILAQRFMIITKYGISDKIIFATVLETPKTSSQSKDKNV